MRESELIGKEVIDVNTGDRIGAIQKSELLIDTATGMVEALILMKSNWTGKEVEVKTIPWSNIYKISDELVLIAGETAKEKI